MRKAFTLIELLVVIAIIAVLVTILVPVVMTGLAKSETTVCQNNLGVMGRKYNDYANDADTADTPFPRHVLVEATGGNIIGNPNNTDVADTGLEANGGSTLDIAATGIGTCGMQTVWVLISEGLVPDSAFKCPGDEDYEARTGAALLKYGWTDLKQFSYGIHYPYDGKLAANDNPADPMDKDGKGRFVYRENMPLLADRNPGGAVIGGTREHSNHPGNDGGCIVVSRIGNTTIHKPIENPPGTFLPDSKVVFGDNIYTDQITLEGAADADEVPQDADDTVITPTISRLP